MVGSACPVQHVEMMDRAEGEEENSKTEWRTNCLRTVRPPAIALKIKWKEGRGTDSGSGGGLGTSAAASPGSLPGEHKDRQWGSYLALMSSTKGIRSRVGPGLTVTTDLVRITRLSLRAT